MKMVGKESGAPLVFEPQMCGRALIARHAIPLCEDLQASCFPELEPDDISLEEFVVGFRVEALPNSNTR